VMRNREFREFGELRELREADPRYWILDPG
jgi:hypothetical protein